VRRKTLQERGAGRLIACLGKQSDKLAPACKKGLEAAEKK
jgi:hypothetical protein